MVNPETLLHNAGTVRTNKVTSATEDVDAVQVAVAVAVVAFVGPIEVATEVATTIEDSDVVLAAGVSNTISPRHGPKPIMGTIMLTFKLWKGNLLRLI